MRLISFNNTVEMSVLQIDNVNNVRSKRDLSLEYTLKKQEHASAISYTHNALDEPY